MIAANMTVTASRKKKVLFSVPVGVVREQVVARASDPKKPKTAADLAGRKVAVRRSSSFHETLTALKKKVPKLEIVEAPESMETEEILTRVAEGEYDLAVADTNLVEAVLTYRDDLAVAFDLGGDRVIAWGVRPGAKALKAALDRYLNTAQISVRRHESYKDDLPGIERRKVVRFLTRNSAATYFLWKGEVLGFEYELAREFARKHGLRLEVVVAPSREDLFTWLDEGKGDIVAASITRTPERLAKYGMSRAYNKVSEVVVSRASFGEALEDMGDLAGRTVVVRRSSSYWSSLERLKEESGIEFTIQAAPEEMETEEIIEKVGKGEYDLTVADGHIVDIELTWRTDVIAAFPLGDPQEHAWVTRKGDKKLQKAIDRFFDEEYRGVVYNLAYRKYFKDARRIRDHAELRADRTGTLSPYDDLIRKYALEFGFDWRLIAAQMYRESRFDPNARSWVGAMGLMQVMPRTAEELGFDDVVDPENGIHAGVEYLAWVRERFEPELPVAERTWFALAAYNAGYGHVLDARRLAKEMKLDPNRWFGNVEKAMLRLSEPAIARRMRFGYARGQEPVDYVREIRDRFDAYARVAPPATEYVAGVTTHDHDGAAARVP